MTGRYLPAPQPPHACNPGGMWVRDEALYGTTSAVWVDDKAPIGSLWECECGRVWVLDTDPGWFRGTWRKEKRRERRKRLKNVVRPKVIHLDPPPKGHMYLPIPSPDLEFETPPPPPPPDITQCSGGY